MVVVQLLKGMGSYVPAKLYNAFSRGTGGTNSARYCYSVWLRHLVMAHKNGLPTNPDVVAELGPGDSLGTGLAALISGANKYYAFDVVDFTNKERNLVVFDELVKLFKNRENIPDNNEFPKVKPYLESYEFPRNILTEERLNEALRQQRTESIRNAILDSGNRSKSDMQILYFVPWYDTKVIKEESADMIFTQSVMQYVDNLSKTYEILSRWLKQGGFMSHTIDFKCLRVSKEWNGYWAYSDLAWKIIKGKRSCLVRREPYSKHINLMQEVGVEVVCNIRETDTSGISKKQLASRFTNMSDDDLTTSGVFIQAVKN